MIFSNILLLLSQVTNASRFARMLTSKLLPMERGAFSVNLKTLESPRFKKFASNMMYAAGGSLITAAIMKNSSENNKKEILDEYLIDSEMNKSNLFFLESARIHSENLGKHESELRSLYNLNIKRIAELSNAEVIQEFRKRIDWSEDDKKYFKDRLDYLNKEFYEEMSIINRTDSYFILTFINEIRGKILSAEKRAFITLRDEMNMEYLQNMKSLISRIDDNLKEK